LRVAPVLKTIDKLEAFSKFLGNFKNYLLK